MRALQDSISPAARFLARHSAIIALAVFAAVGFAVFDDYGVAGDEWLQRSIGYASFNYILGYEDELSGYRYPSIERFYGVAFEVPLIAIERALGLEDSRDVYLSRHLTAHLLFLAGGFFAWLLAYRLFGSRLIALLAMLLFLLHPRLYAHSFFNTKDLPFLSAFTLALYLTHRAFRRDTVWAFALCGAGVGLLVNVRIIGVMLIPAVLGMLALDAFHAVKRGDGSVKHILASASAFLTAFAAVFYAAWPLLWREPLGAIEALGTMSQYPHHWPTLFRGETVRWPNVPWDFIPTWILITTPPVALLLAALGIGQLARLCAARWGDALANSTARFGLLAVGCLTLPAVAAVALNSNLYSGWRHMYFLYAPLLVLAAFGLRALAEIPKASFRAGAFAAAALGIALAVVQMVQIHPYQNEYFNSLVDKGGLVDRWDMGYWYLSRKEALETLLTMQPSGPVAVAGAVGLRTNMWIIPEDDLGAGCISTRNFRHSASPRTVSPTRTGETSPSGSARFTAFPSPLSWTGAPSPKPPAKRFTRRRGRPNRRRAPADSTCTRTAASSFTSKTAARRKTRADGSACTYSPPNKAICRNGRGTRAWDMNLSTLTSLNAARYSTASA